MNNQLLSGKLALVTGSSRGIGAAIAQRLASEGAAVLVHYSSSRNRADDVVAEIRKAGGEAEAIGGDLASREGPAALLGHIDAAFGGRFGGRLDILVNNAGTGEFGSLTESTDEQFDKQFNLNVRAVYILAREAARRMTRAGWGRIINIGSGLGERVPMPGMALYCGTKFAVNGLTRGWSRDLGSTGVTVNSVQPGPVDTELNPADGPMSELQKKMTSVGRYGKPEEIAAAVAFLARPESAFINGENLTVDGGWNA
jgi:3-oxoacyl-[acyl-carrier protein] reductase